MTVTNKKGGEIMNTKADEIIKLIWRAKCELENHIISDADCESIDGDNADYDEAMLINELNRLESHLADAYSSVCEIVGTDIFAITG